MPSSQTLLAAIALVILGVLAGLLTFHAVPQDNRELLSMIVGALAGALTVGGLQKVAAHVSTPDAQIGVREAGS